jgi:TPR repeat protein
LRVSHLAGVALGLAFLGCKADTRAGLSTACVNVYDGEACARFAALLERGKVRTLFPEEPGVYFALACQEGSLESCARAEPWVKVYSDYETLERDVGCMLKNDAFACEELARTLRDDSPSNAEAVVLATSRLARALSLYLEACASGEAASCLGAARVHRSGLGAAADLLAAEAEELKACALGLGLACEIAGDHAAAKDASALYQRACDLPPSLPRACLKLARTSEMAAAPPATISTDYRQACERLSVDACRWMAQHAASPNRESPATHAAFQRFCASGEAWACWPAHG